ncbi:hypothetical protein TNCV_2069731 [Trichonephila clavipes]|uniref:Uncharacterized protein n=1 Tax=Trichonephila clavipes TaxID=2585209 RepID=A0A8X6W2Z8_TRICX|nr:hypothetical protein TNCV_2069731 [Trichonephila clavipes]
MPFGQGKKSVKGMDVCKCIVPLRHGGTLNSHRAAIPVLKSWWKEKRGEKPLTTPTLFSLKNWGGAEPNLTVTCMVFKTTSNDRRKSLTPCRDEK